MHEQASQIILIVFGENCFELLSKTLKPVH